MKSVKSLGVLAQGHVVCGIMMAVLCWWHIELVRAGSSRAAVLSRHNGNLQVIQSLARQSLAYAHQSQNQALVADLARLGISATPPAASEPKPRR